ncbi:MAG TPA: ester cyclase [Polyangiaceae bacterium]
MSDDTTKNKEIIRRFNRDVIGGADPAAYDLFDPEFVNRTAMAGFDAGIEGMRTVFETVLRRAMPDLAVTVHDQIAEGDRVVTRKTLHGTHRGPFFDVAPTGGPITIEVIDIFRLRNGRLLEHWGKNDLPSVIARLKESK